MRQNQLLCQRPPKRGRKGMKKKTVTGIVTGAGATGLSLTSSLTTSGSACTGVCGACGLGCASFVGIAAAGLIAVMAVRGKKKLKAQQINE